MNASNSWAIDGDAAHRFLALLGKDPSSTRLRAFPHRRDPRRAVIGARKGGFDLRQAERWQREGRGVYVVINDGGDRNSAIRQCRALFVEWDDRPLDWQRQAWRELGLPEPTAMVASGGRSLHCYWVLREPLAPALWHPLQRELIKSAQGDASCGDLARVMRLPGSWYLDANGQPLAPVLIEAASGQRYGADELAAALLAAAGVGDEGDADADSVSAAGLLSGLLSTPQVSEAPSGHSGRSALLPATSSAHTTSTTAATSTTPSTLTPTMTTPKNASPSWDDICAALAVIPPRVAGSNSYGIYRNILWGLIRACEETGRDQEAAIALMEAHSPSSESGWDVRQVASSGGEEISSATFWFHARHCGWRPEGQQSSRPAGRHRPQIHRSAGAQGPAGAQSTGAQGAGASAPITGAPGPRRGPIHLPLARRLDALEHCIGALLGREANSLRRHARVRQAQAALELKALLRHQEIGQLILEAHDKRHGNRFHPLGSSQRLTMTVPQLSWEIPDCLPSRDLTILGGRAKVGKTRLAHALLRCLLCAEDFLGFGAPTQPRPVILISDDQADGDTAQMLQASGMWGHPLLLWSRRFRATETNLEALRDCLAEQSGAVVMLDSLRSITRSCCFGENDPEMGSLIYDLKHQITDAGGTVLLVHHCNKANDTTGTEALSGHNAIAGAANTILTLHYLSQEARLLKDSPQRRLVREARSGPPVDLVVAMEDSGGRFVRVGPYSDVLEEQEVKVRREKAEQFVLRCSPEQQQALHLLLERHQRGEDGMSLLELLQAIGAVPASVRRKQELERDELNLYKGLGRLLNDLKGMVVITRIPGEGQGYSLRYALNAAGARWLEQVLEG
jgi:hypothetical protein